MAAPFPIIKRSPFPVLFILHENSIFCNYFFINRQAILHFHPVILCGVAASVVYGVIYWICSFI